MVRIKILPLWIGCLLSVSTVTAQEEMNMWLRGTLQLPVTSKLVADAEWQYRQNVHLEHSDISDKNQLQSFRIWGHYKLNEDIKLSVSPIAYFSRCKTTENAGDKIMRYSSELRSSIALALQHRLFGHLYVFDRTAAEYRMLSAYDNDVVRLRNRIGLRYDFSEKVNLSLSDEHLLNLSGTEHHHFFDQNRITLNLDYSVSSKFKLDVGYMAMEQLPLTGNVLLNEHIVYLNLTYRLM